MPLPGRVECLDPFHLCRSVIGPFSLGANGLARLVMIAVFPCGALECEARLKAPPIPSNQSDWGLILLRELDLDSVLVAAGAGWSGFLLGGL